MGVYLVCPDNANFSTDGNERPYCRTSDSLSAWELLSTDELNPIVDLAPLETLTNMIDILFTFDPELFGIVLFGCAMLFTTGWGAGVIIRKLSKGN